MNRQRLYFGPLAHSVLGIVFALLIMMQSISISHSGTRIAASPINGVMSESLRAGSVVDFVSSQLCDHNAKNGAPSDGDCHHIGFCALCTTSDRTVSLDMAPAPSRLLLILTPDDEVEGRPSLSEERLLPLPSSSGLSESHYPTAPPAV